MSDSFSDVKILVIDDEETIRWTLEGALETVGFQPIAAEDGQKGLDIFKKDNDIGVILTDLMMPAISGMQVLEQAKEIDPDVEVIMLTGFGGKEPVIEAMKKGAYDYLQKPMNMEELFLTIRKALERRRLSVENRQYQKNLERLVAERTAELTKTQNFLKSVLDSSTDYSIIATDLKGRITLFNKGSERLLGYSSDEVEGRRTVLLFGQDKGQEEAGPFGEDPRRFSEEGAHTQEKVIRRKDGGEVTISLTTELLHDLSGKVVGTLGIAKDISEQKKLEEEVKKYTENLENLVEERTEELKKRNSELEQTLNELGETQAQLVQSEKLASIGQLAAGVAHEINNPTGFVHSNLSTLKKYMDRIKGLLETMHEKSKDDEEVKKLWKKSKIEFILEDIESIIEESQEGTMRVRTIVKDLKNVSNLDRAQIGETNIEEGLESTLNIVWNELKYNAEVIKEFSNIPSIECNPQQLNQVFLNLLVNASHAIDDPPGTIWLRTRELDDQHVVVEIEDTGCGIPEEKREKIFDAFYTTKEIGKGTGLGLSISLRIIKQHGGRIEVESEVGKGTIFRVILPVKMSDDSLGEK